ncbi:hypothetical protein ACFL1U_01730 [Patescibacteria group bacterium]
MLTRILTAVLLPALVVVVLAGASCKSTQTIETPGGDVNVTTDGGTVTVEDQEGTAQTTFGTGLKLADDFPSDAPAYPGGNLITVSDASDEASIKIHSVSWTTSDSNDTVEDWYRTELEKQGWNITFSSTTNEVTSIVCAKDARALTVAISVAENLTTIALTVSSGI